MNSCILMAEIVQEPQLRYTPDQTPLAEMLVEFPAARAEDPPATLKVVGWGNLAQEIQQHYHQGDRVIIEGRLTMSTVDRPEGFKEKRAELTVQKIHPLGGGASIGSTATGAMERSRQAHTTQSRPPVATPSNGGEFGTRSSLTPDQAEERASSVGVIPQPDPVAPVPQRNTPQVPQHQAPTNEPDVDDIPF